MQIKKHLNNSELQKSTVELNHLMQEVLQMASDEGATDAAISVNHDRGFSVDVRMGEVETVAFSEDRAIALTVYLGQRKGSASSTDTTPAALRSMVRAAVEIAKVSSEDPCFGLAEKALMQQDYADLDLFHPWDIAPPQAIEMALACEAKALAMDKRIVNSDGVNVSSYESHHGYANTNGSRGFVHSTRHGLGCSLIASQGDEMKRDHDYTSQRDSRHLRTLEDVAQSVVERTVSRLGALKIKTEAVPVIFSSRVSSGLISSFIGAISGSNLYRKNSFLLDSVGQLVFPEWMRIHEQPYLLNALGSASFDSEGVPTRNNVFVEQGKVMQYALGSYSARRLGLATTANADGVHNLTVDANATSLEELIADMKRGLVVTELMGQGVNMITGDYSRGASGFWVEDGVIQFPVEEITVAGNLKEMYRGIVAVGSDINPNISTRCGSILIDKMMVAGA